jgi:hypothetical protein
VRDPSTPPLTPKDGAPRGGPTGDFPGGPREGPRRKGEPLGYSFDAMPTAMLGMVRDGKLKAIDALVLTVLLRFRRRSRDSCWCAKHTLSKEIGRTERTVRSSLRRLGECGLIEQVPVPKPDPDEPRNRTGWRIVFLWLAPPGRVKGPGPDRRPNAERRAWVRVGGKEISCLSRFLGSPTIAAE